MSMNENEKRIVKLLLANGFTPEILGFKYLIATIELYISDDSIPFCELYAMVGELFNTTASRVERAIRHSIEKNVKSKVTNSCFIATCALELNMGEDLLLVNEEETKCGN